MKIILEPAFVLHSRPYRETSLLIDFFTYNHGKISGVARSARGMRSRFKGCLVPFSPLFISGVGKTDLMQVTAVETHGAAYFLQGTNLFSGIYLNELLMKLLQRQDAYPNLFDYYQKTLHQLQIVDEPQKALRIFEKQLLAELGYGLQLSQESSGDTINPDKFYSYTLDQGIIPCEQNKKSSVIFSGSNLLAIEKNNFDTAEILKDARRLMRLALTALLGKNQIKSRELFTTY